MSTTINQNQRPDALELIASEIKRSEDERIPTSRQMLAELVQRKTSLNHSDAMAMVEGYCEEHAPAVPQYLAEEFAIPYLKVIAILNVVVALGLFYWGIQVFRIGKQPAWPWFAIGTVVVGFGVLAWVKSLERFAARKRTSRS